MLVDTSFMRSLNGGGGGIEITHETATDFQQRKWSGAVVPISGVTADIYRFGDYAIIYRINGSAHLDNSDGQEYVHGDGLMLHLPSVQPTWVPQFGAMISTPTNKRRNSQTDITYVIGDNLSFFHFSYAMESSYDMDTPKLYLSQSDASIGIAKVQNYEDYYYPEWVEYTFTDFILTFIDASYTIS